MFLSSLSENNSENYGITYNYVKKTCPNPNRGKFNESLNIGMTNLTKVLIWTRPGPAGEGDTLQKTNFSFCMNLVPSGLPQEDKSLLLSGFRLELSQ